MDFSWKFFLLCICIDSFPNLISFLTFRFKSCGLERSFFINILNTLQTIDAIFVSLIEFIFRLSAGCGKVINFKNVEEITEEFVCANVGIGNIHIRTSADAIQCVEIFAIQRERERERVKKGR